MFKKINELIGNESGQGMVEYGLIIALVAVAAIVGLTLLGGGLREIFNDITGELGVDGTGGAGEEG
ncbi:MAG: Flp family type IVb pilin [Anaerovoracaceae bacterium]|jgi:pilus assembly protein Flp/PilA